MIINEWKNQNELALNIQDLKELEGNFLSQEWLNVALKKLGYKIIKIDRNIKNKMLKLFGKVNMLDIYVSNGKDTYILTAQENDGLYLFKKVAPL